MSALERQKQRIQVLQAIAEQAHFSSTAMVYKKNLQDSIPETIGPDSLVAHVFYLAEKNYLEIMPLRGMGRDEDFAYATITAHGIDLVEKLEDGRDVSDYAHDFAPQVLINIQQGSHSQASVLSSNVTQSIRHDQAYRQLRAILQTLKERESENPAVQTAVTQLETQLSADAPNHDRIIGMIQIVLSLSQVAAQLFTPEIRASLGF